MTTTAALPQETATPWPVVVATALMFLGVGATLPVLPGAVRDAGGSPAALGVVLGVFPFAALAGRLVAGRWSDRRGRVWTLRAGLLTTLASGAVLALPTTVPALAGARLLHGLGDALVYTAAAALVLDRSAPERRAQAVAWLGAALWAGYSAGPLLGAALDVRGAGLVVVLCSVAGLALATRLPEHVPGPSGARGLAALVPVGSGVPALALGLGNLGYAAVVGFLVLQVDADGGRGAVALTAFSLAVLLGRLAVVPLAVRLGLLRSLPLALVAMAGGLVGLATTSGTGPAVACCIVIGLGYCLPFPALAALVADRVGPSQRGAALGALTASYDLFVGVGSLAFGLLASGAGTRAVFLAAAGGVLLAAAVNASVARGERRRGLVAADAAPDA